MTTDQVKAGIDLACDLIKLNKQIFTDDFVTKAKMLEQKTKILDNFLKFQEGLFGDKTSQTIEKLQELKNRPLIIRAIARFT